MLNPATSHRAGAIFSTPRSSMRVKSSKYVDPVGQTIVWTVVSRAPYLKAVAYYPQRRAGGWFLNQHEYCVLGGSSHPDDRESPEVRRVEAAPPAPSLYEARLVREGWAVEDLRAQFAARIDYVKQVGKGWELRYSPQKGYRLTKGLTEADTSGWEWADVDGKRLVWAAKGCLWAGHLQHGGIQRVELLHDFNGMSFERLAAPYEGGRPVTRTPTSRHHSPTATLPAVVKRGKAPSAGNRIERKFAQTLTTKSSSVPAYRDAPRCRLSGYTPAFGIPQDRELHSAVYERQSLRRKPAHIFPLRPA